MGQGSDEAMFLPDMMGAIWRRWYFVLVGALLTAGVGSQAIHTTDRYLASEVVVIQPPVSNYAPNPMTGLYPSMAVTAAAVAKSLNTPDAQATFRAQGITGQYEFAPRNTGTNQEPLYLIASMTITNIGFDEKETMRELGLLRAGFENALKALQDKWFVKKTLRMVVADLVPASSTLLPHSPIRSLIGTGLLGVVATAAIVLWFDERFRRRRGGRIVAEAL
jgi:hypothetical protein